MREEEVIVKRYACSIVCLLILGILVVSCRPAVTLDETAEAKITQAVSGEPESPAGQSAMTPDPCQDWLESSGTVMVVASIVGEEDEGRLEIATILEDGERCRLLELTGANTVWISPQHDKLTWFASGKLYFINLKTSEIKVMEPAGGEMEGGMAITFNPAGTRIAIVQQEWETETKENEMPWPKETWRFVLVDLETEEQKILHNGPVNAYPCAESDCISSQYMRILSLGWSGATGEMMLAVYHWVPMGMDILRDVYAIDVETGEARLVMAVEEGALGVFEDVPRMSPDGRWLATIMPPDGRTIGVRSVSDGEVSSIQIADEIGSARPLFLKWLPDNQHVSFMAEDWQGKDQYAGRVLVDTKSGQETRLEAVEGDIHRWCSADVLIYAQEQELRRVDLRSQESELVGDISKEWIVDCWVNE
jgi:hypothetical protein